MKSDSNDDRIGIVIVDDHPMTLDGLIGYAETDPEILVLASTQDGEEAIALVEQHLPDVVLMDLRLDRSTIDGVEATRRISAISPSTQVLVLSAYDDDSYVFPALKAGAMGYVLKTASPGEILDAIHAVARRQPFLDRQIYEKLRLFIRSIDGDMVSKDEAALTPREWEVLNLLANGLTNNEIAEALVISVKTVRTHVSNIFEKLHLHSRIEARFWALQRRTEERGCEPI